MSENRGGPEVHAGEISPELDRREVDGSIRLDLGCGDKREKGWIGVDVRNDGGRIQPDIIADISKPLPLPDDYADEMRAIHVIEHFWPWDVAEILKEWFRVLKPGGMLAIECPSIDKVLYLMQVPECPPSMTWWALYGDPRHKSPEMMHRWCYGKTQMARLMNEAGFVNIAPAPVRFHHPIRDMRMEGFKPFPTSRIVVPE